MRRFRDVGGMSGLPLAPDISGLGRHFAFVPVSDVVGRFDSLSPATGRSAMSRRCHASGFYCLEGGDKAPI
jgi:hypothetical protein